jgi:hypothetical protein
MTKKPDKDKKSKAGAKVNDSRYIDDIKFYSANDYTSRWISKWLSEQDPPEKIAQATIFAWQKNYFNKEEEVRKLLSGDEDANATVAALKDLDQLKKLKDFGMGAMDIDIDLNLPFNVDKNDEDSREFWLKVQNLNLQFKKAGIQAIRAYTDLVKALGPKEENKPAVQNNIFVQGNQTDRKTRLHRIEEETKSSIIVDVDPDDSDSDEGSEGYPETSISTTETET